MLMYYWYLTKYGPQVSILKNSKNLDLQKSVFKKKMRMSILGELPSIGKCYGNIIEKMLCITLYYVNLIRN